MSKVLSREDWLQIIAPKSSSHARLAGDQIRRNQNLKFGGDEILARVRVWSMTRLRAIQTGSITSASLLLLSMRSPLLSLSLDVRAWTDETVSGVC
jgi:hypothetical protein